MARRLHRSAATTPKSLKSNPELHATAELAARHWMEPYRQGEFDNLCSLYACINLLRLALAQHDALTRMECRRLFYAGCEWLDDHALLGVTATGGLELKRRNCLLRFMIGQLKRPGLSVAIERTSGRRWHSIDQTFAWISASLTQGKPVLVSLEGSYQHYTVAAGITPMALLFFDSMGMQFLRRSSCALRDCLAIIPQRGLLRIAVEPSG